MRQVAPLLCLLLACTQPREPPATAGGAGASPRVNLSALVDAGGTWSQNTQMNKGRSHHAATLLLNGKVLVTGGVEPTTDTVGVYSLNNTELYDPATGRSSYAGAMNKYRFNHTATLLHDGRVLVAGGLADKGPLALAEIHDPKCPASDDGATCARWTQIQSMHHSRAAHTATLLRDGRVLVVGGISFPENPLADPFVVAPPEVYDPATGQWTDAANLGEGNRGFHTATLLPDGRVLVLGGMRLALFQPPGFTHIKVQQTGLPLSDFYAKFVDSADLYDPRRDTWTHLETGLTTRRIAHTATLMPDGKVLVVGGWLEREGSDITVNLAGMTAAGVTALASAELYDASTQAGGSVPAGSVLSGRAFHTATLLPEGRVLVTGGTAGEQILDTTWVYDPNQSEPNRWSPAAPLPDMPRALHTATLLPGGRVLVTGGYWSGKLVMLTSILHDANTSAWSSVGSMGEPRREFTSTLLPDGKVLVAGGTRQTADSAQPLGSAELHAPSDGGAWSAALTASLREARRGHSATLLPDGKVLVAGGFSADGVPLSSAEVYDPAASPPSWTRLPSQLAYSRGAHTATLLPTGRVLVVGGRGSTIINPSSEEYDLAAKTWGNSRDLGLRYANHTATLLVDGTVLIAGGRQEFNSDPKSKLYDAFTRTWTPTANELQQARYSHTATLLPDGRVFVTGGYRGNESQLLGDSELYEPSTRSWTPSTEEMSQPRARHAAILLPTGQVLVTGGYGEGGALLDSAELYDPATNSWSPAPPMSQARADHSLVALPDGSVLVLGGRGHTDVLSSVEVYSAPGGPPAQRPLITRLEPTNDVSRSSFEPGLPLSVTGERFRGGSESSGGGTGSSAVDFPLLRLRSFETGQWFTPPGVSFSDSSVTAPLPPRLPDGHYLLNITSSGQTTSTVIRIRNLAPPDTFFTSPSELPPDGPATSASFRFSSNDRDVRAYECSLEGSGFTPCASPLPMTDLGDGTHTLQVRARDLADHVDPTPAQHAWLVDTQAPEAVFVDTPLSRTRDTSAIFHFGSSATDVASYECSLDGAGFTPCTSPQSVTDLGDGGHTFQVRAIDRVGNVSQEPAGHSWTVMRGYYGLSCASGDGSLWLGGPWALLLLGLRGRRRPR